MKRYEDEGQNSQSPGFVLAPGLLICLCGVGICLAFGTSPKVRARASANEPMTLAATCAASEQQISRLRLRDNFPRIEVYPNNPVSSSLKTMAR